MKFWGVLFLIWGVGYVTAMFITVKGLPSGPAFLFFAIGILLLSLAKIRKQRDNESKKR